MTTRPSPLTCEAVTCAANAACTLVDEQPRSVPRNEGFTGDGVTACADLDACSVTPCADNATRADEPAPSTEATCTCKPGYEGDPTTACSDIDACSSNECGANAVCSDQAAPALGFDCTCNPGFEGDARRVQRHRRLRRQRLWRQPLSV